MNSGETYRTHSLRAPCRYGCGNELLGYIRPAGGQDVVRCARCDKAQYNAPKTETGKRARTVSTVHAAIKPKQRSRILERATGRCERCGARDRLHVGHMLSVKAGLDMGLTEAELNHDENLCALCEECNLGQGAEPMSLRLAIAILRARITWTETA